VTCVSALLEQLNGDLGLPRSSAPLECHRSASAIAADDAAEHARDGCNPFAGAMPAAELNACTCSDEHGGPAPPVLPPAAAAGEAANAHVDEATELCSDGGATAALEAAPAAQPAPAQGNCALRQSRCDELGPSAVGLRHDARSDGALADAVCTLAARDATAPRPASACTPECGGKRERSGSLGDGPAQKRAPVALEHHRTLNGSIEQRVASVRATHRSRYELCPCSLSVQILYKHCQPSRHCAAPTSRCVVTCSYAVNSSTSQHCHVAGADASRLAHRSSLELCLQATSARCAGC
jgi:hypothetical protein